MTETQAPASLLPMDDTLTKKEIEQHLRDHHQGRPYHHNTKTLKNELLRWHSNVHMQVENGGPSERAQYERMVRVPHLHKAMTAEEIATAIKAGGLDLAKPLTPAEANVLRDLIDNDFNALKQEMRAMAADTKRSRVEAVQKEWEKRTDKSAYYDTRARDMLRRQQQEADVMIEKAKGDGIQLSIVGRADDHVSVKLVGKAEAVQAAGAEVDADLNRALITLERQRLTAQRVVMLSRVTPEATKVLEMVPTAQRLMVEAAQDRQRKEVGA